MLEGLVEQQVARVGKIKTEFPFSSAQMNIMGHIKFVLKPFKDITNTLSTATAMLGDVIPIADAQEKMS